MEENLNFLLYQCVKGNDPLGTIFELLDQGANPNYQSTFGKAPLHMASQKLKDDEVIEALITAGADVNLNDHLSYTALHYAVMLRKADSVYLSVQYGACINAKTFLGETPLHIAVLTLQSARCFFDYDVSVIKYLTKQKGININAKDCIGNTPFLIAVQDSKEGVVELLLDCHADLNVPNYDSELPLHAAFRVQAHETQRLLLTKGASIYSLEKNGKTPLEIYFEINSGMTTDDSDNSETPQILLEYIALHYRIISDLKQKLRFNSELSQYFNNCVEEVVSMRNNYIIGKITMHDFLCDCCNEKEYKSLLEIYLPVVERLIKDDYPLFLIEILNQISDSRLHSILQMAAGSKNCAKIKRETKLFVDVFSLSHVTLLISKHLSKYDIFNLIVVISDC